MNNRIEHLYQISQKPERRILGLLADGLTNHQIADEMFLAALRLGGTLTGEHGIGILKKRWLRDELGDDQFDLQQKVKAVFDPLGILNPGKVF